MLDRQLLRKLHNRRDCDRNHRVRFFCELFPHPWMLRDSPAITRMKNRAASEHMFGSEEKFGIYQFLVSRSGVFCLAGLTESAIEICVTNYCCKRRSRMHNEAGNKIVNVPISAPSKPDIPNRQVISLTICTPFWKNVLGFNAKVAVYGVSSCKSQGSPIKPRKKKKFYVSVIAVRHCLLRPRKRCSPRRSFVFAFVKSRGNKFRCWIEAGMCNRVALRCITLFNAKGD